MKKFLAVVLVLVTLALSVTCFAEEVFRPGRNNTGLIGDSTHFWRQGFFQTLSGFRVEIASKDWGGASDAWTLSATERRAAILYLYNAASGATIVGPSESGRVYTVFNNSGQSVTIKKAAGTGIAIANGKVATVAYFTSKASEDYMRLTADETF
jgi:hypothetical protein